MKQITGDPTSSLTISKDITLLETMLFYFAITEFSYVFCDLLIINGCLYVFVTFAISREIQFLAGDQQMDCGFLV